MIISAIEMCDNIEIQIIRQNILAIGGGESGIWKKSAIVDQKLFNQLFRFIFSEDLRLAWRSCRIIDNAAEEGDSAGFINRSGKLLRQLRS